MFTQSAPADETRLLRTKQVLELVPLSRPTIYRLADKGDFPKPIRVGTASLWPEAEIKEWVAGRLASR